MKSNNKINKRYQPYYNNNLNSNILLNVEILSNLKELHKNAKNDQKSNILSIVSYDYMKPILKKVGFKFSNSQFKTAQNKLVNENINSNNYKSHIPKRKTKFSQDEKDKIKGYLYRYYKQSSSKTIILDI